MDTINHISGKLRLLLLLSFLIAAVAARAQITVRIITIPPLGSDLDEMAGAEIGGHFLVMLSQSVATNAGTPYVKIAGTLECLSPTPFSITLNPNFRPAAPIILTGAAPVTLTPAQVGEAFGNFIQGNMVAQGISLSSLLNAGGGLHYQLPEGTYRLCITAYGYDANGYTRPISDPNSGCTTFTICYKASAPQFVLPVNTLALPSGVPVVNPSYPVAFTWTASNTTCGAAISPVTYTLEMHQIFAGQSPQDALNNPPVFTKAGLPSVVFPFDTLLYPNILQQGKQYAIRVRASSSTFANVSSIVFANNGFSTVGAFQYGQAGPAVASGNTPQVIVPAVQPVNNGPNCVAPPSNTTPMAATSLAGSNVKVAGFPLNIDPSVRSDSGGTWTGTGNIVWTPFGHPIEIAVSFTRIAVNTDGNVFSGTVTANANTAPLGGQPLNQWSNFSQLSPAALDNLAGSLSNYIQNNPVTQMVHEIKGTAPVTLPLGLDSTSLGSQDVTLDIVSMSFTAQGGTMNALLGIPIPEMSGTLTLAGVNICLSPSGVNGSSGTLMLPVDRPFNMGGMSVTLKGSGGMIPDSTKGTYVSWSGGQLQEIVAHMDMTLPKALVPELSNGSPATGSPLTAQAIIQFYSWSDWIAGIGINTFEIAGVPNVGLSPSTIWYDHSTKSNPTGFAYPTNYPVADQQPGQGFEGLFIPNMKIMLPSFFQTFGNSQRVSFAAQNLILDDNGVTVNLQGQHVIDGSNGNLGGWAFSLDSMGISIVENTFYSGGFSGGIFLPVSTTKLQYTADLQTGANGGQFGYSFVVAPAGNLKFDLWAATVVLGSGSNITVQNTSGTTSISATLNGMIGFNIQQTKPSLFFDSVVFTGLGLNNNSGSLQFTPGTWSLASTENIAGFGIVIDTPQAYSQAVSSGLRLGVTFPKIQITLGDFTVASASTSLSIYGQVNFNPNAAPTPSLTPGVQVNEIGISGEVGPLSVDGSVIFYNGNALYGNGVKGSVTAGIENMFSVTATIQFGNVANPNTGKAYNYWFVDACATIPVAPIAPSPFGFSGFGGGFYHNMSMFNTSNLPKTNFAAQQVDPTDPSSTASGVQYRPGQGTDGFLANVTFATVTTPAVLNGILQFGGQMSNGSISGLELIGDVFAFSTNSNNAIVSGTDTITVTFGPNHSVTFDANSRFQNGGIWGSGRFDVPIAIHAGPDGWFFKLGDPVDTTKRVSFELINDQTLITSLSLQVKAYFAVGSPQLMAGWTLNSDRGVSVSPGAEQALSMVQNSSSLEFLFGADVTISFKFAFACIYADAGGGAGFDVALMYNTNGTTSCNSTGWNGWYAAGDVYAYAYMNVGIAVDVWFANGNFNLCTLSAGVDLQGGLPNPTWGVGSAYIGASILNGWVTFYGTATISVGPKHCYPNVPSPLSNLQIVEKASPTDSNADVLSVPQFTTSIPLTQPYSLEIPPSATNPNGSTVTYEVLIGSCTLSGGGQTVTTDIAYENYYTNMYLNHKAMLLPNTKYTVKIVFNILEYFPEVGVWGFPGAYPGTPMGPPVADYQFSFTTGAAPKTLVDENINLSYPVNGQRYVLKNEMPEGFIHLNEWQTDILQAPGGSSIPYTLYFIDMVGGDTVKSTFAPNPAGLALNFVFPKALQNTTLYRAEFWVMGSPPKEIYTLYFGTSHYNTMADKIADWGTWGGTRNGYNITIVNSGGYPGEDFDAYELFGFTAPDGTSYPALFSASIPWNTSAQNESNSNQVYNYVSRLYSQYQLSSDFTPNAVRTGGFDLEPVNTVDWSGWSYDPPLTTAEMLPVGQTEANTGGGSNAGATRQLIASSNGWQNLGISSIMKQPSGPKTFDPGKVASLNTAGGLIFTTSSDAGSQKSKTTSGRGNGLKLNNIPRPLLWTRDYYIHDDFECMNRAGNGILSYFNLLEGYHDSPAQLQNFLNSGGSSLMWFGLTDDGNDAMTIPYNQFYTLYKNGALEMVALCAMKFQPYPSGVSRPVTFSYTVQNQQNNIISQGQPVNVNFIVK